MNTLSPYLITSLMLLVFGIFIVLTQRNIFRFLMGIILIFNSACLNFVVFSRFIEGGLRGHVITLFIIIIAIAELVVVLATIISMNRHVQKVNLNEMNSFKG